jgi:hypothetical protein
MVALPFTPGFVSRSIAVADPDQDGDLEVVAGGTDAASAPSVHVHPNRHRQTELVAQPVLGDQTISIRAVSVPGANPGGEAALLAAALTLSPVPTPFPPLTGLMGLDPATAAFLGTGLIPAGSGEVVFTFALNYTTALVGAQIFYESAIVDATGAATLTNTLTVQL